MEWFNQQNDSQNSQPCSCNKRGGIFIDKRQLNRTIALFLLVGVFIFVGGYFWGQRTATDQMLNVVERDSFADQIYYSMCSMYDLKDDESNEPDVVSGIEEETERASEQQQVANGPSSAPTEVKVEPAQATYTPAKPVKKYFAQLVGFGSAVPAQQLVDRLAKKSIKVVVQKRQSKTAKGKVVNWYQVVTPQFTDKNDLNKVVATIKKIEKIHDVRIVEAGVA
jgi:hypothetical protein